MKPTIIITDTGRAAPHVIPLVGMWRVKDLTNADINKVLKDITAEASILWNSLYQILQEHISQTLFRDR